MQTLDQRRQVDHDVLIRLDAKVDRLSLDIKDLKDGLGTRMATLEVRMDGYEKLVTVSDPDRRIREHDQMFNWMREIKRTWKFLLAGAIGLGFLLSQIKTIIDLLT